MTKYLKTFTIVLLMIIVTGFISPVKVSALPDDLNNIEELKSSVNSKVKYYMDLSNNTYTGQLGLLYNLKNILIISEYATFIEQDKSLDFSTEEKRYYSNFALSNIEKFNKIYGTTDTGNSILKPIKLNNINGLQNTTLDLETIVTLNVAPYIRELLNEVLSKYTAQGAVKQKVIDDNRQTLLYCYDIIKLYTSTNNDINDVIPMKYSNEDISVPIKSWDFTPPLKPFSNILNESKYAELLQASRVISETQVQQLIDNGLSKEGNLIDRVTTDNKKRFTPALTAMIAASAIYRPLESHAGDADFRAALSKIVTNAPEVLLAYDQLKAYKKPLRFQKINANGTTKGDAKQISIKEFIKQINDETSGALVAIKGKFETLPDTDTWGYYHGPENQVVIDAPKASVTPPSPAVDNKTVPTDKNSYLTTNDTPTISDQNIIAKPVLIYGKTSIMSDLFLSTVILHNIFKDMEAVATKLDTSGSGLLFVNALGDIVTADDLIILPASANPTYISEAFNYYPYTVAFMNFYPTGVSSLSDKFHTTNPRDDGKYLLGTAVNNPLTGTAPPPDMKPIIAQPYTTFSTKVKSNDKTSYLGFGGTVIKQGMDFQMMDFGTGNISMFASKLFGGKDLMQTLTNGVFNKANDTNYYFIRENTSLSINSTKTLSFPHKSSEDSGMAEILIAQNMYWSYTTDKNGSQSNKGNGRIDEEYFCTNVLVEALNGSPNVAAYVKNYITDYENFIKGSADRLSLSILYLCEPLIDSFSKMDGILGLKSSYQQPILGKILEFCDAYLIYLILALLIIIISKFMRKHYGLIYVMFSGAVTIVIFYCFVKVFPVYLPTVYNVVSNNLNTEIYYNTLMMKSEKYGDTYGKSGDTDKNGRLIMSTSSINLYKINNADLQDLSHNLGIEKTELVSGKAYLLDVTSGLFVEGNVLKMNIDKMFSSLPITGAYVTINGNRVYQISAKKMVSSALDYYTPYYQITDAFISKLNKMCSAYQIQSSQLNYGNGLAKDSFSIYSYINSSLFLTPGEFKSEESSNDPQLVQMLRDEFSNNSDFLGIHDVLQSNNDDIKATLWYNTLKQNGYYDSEEKMKDLVEYVNLQTKKFINSISGQAKYVSDDNLIKIISLYALCSLDQRASNYFNYLYPNEFNYEELKLGDVLLPVITSDYDKYISQNLNLGAYVLQKYNWFNLLIFTGFIVNSYVFMNLINFAIPVIYVLLALVLSIRFYFGSGLSPALKGSGKSSFIIFMCYTTYSFILTLAYKFNDSFLSIWLLFVVGLLLLVLAGTVCACVILNPLEIGNSKINAAITKIADKLKITSLIEAIQMRTANITRTDANSNDEYDNVYKNQYKKYRNDSDILDPHAEDSIVNSIVSTYNKNNKISYKDREIFIDSDTHTKQNDKNNYKYSSDLKEDSDYLDDFRNHNGGINK